MFEQTETPGSPGAQTRRNPVTLVPGRRSNSCKQEHLKTNSRKQLDRCRGGSETGRDESWGRSETLLDHARSMSCCTRTSTQPAQLVFVCCAPALLLAQQSLGYVQITLAFLAHGLPLGPGPRNSPGAPKVQSNILTLIHRQEQAHHPRHGTAGALAVLPCGEP